MKSLLKSLFIFVLYSVFLNPIIANKSHSSNFEKDMSLMPINFTFQGGSGAVNSEICLDLLPQNFTDILGMQFTIDFDPAVLEFVSIKEATPNTLRIDEEFPEDNFGLPGVGNVPAGKITFVWDAPGARPVTIDDNVPLFSICFRVLTVQETTLQLSDEPTAIQVVDQNEQELEVSQTPGTINEGQGSSSPPNAEFSANSTTVNEGTTINFTDQSTGNPTSRSWSFPGGTPSSSTSPNPSITYSSAGTYNVTLTVTNSDGSDTETKSGYITVNAVNSGFDGFTLDIDDATGSVNSEVCLPVRGHNFTDVLGMQFSIDYDPSILEYSTIKEGARELRIDEEFLADNFGLPGVGGVPLGKITFVWDAPGAREISLDDGTILFELCFTVKTNSATVVSFSDSPTDIQVIDKDEQQISFNSDPGTVNGGASGSAPNANFSANATTVSAGSTVQFTDQSTGSPTSWSWTFAGGTPATSNSQNPSIRYDTPGTYNVTLTASNVNGSDVETKVGYITVTDGIISFDEFTLDITDVSGNVNEEVCVQINAYKFTDILGMQFTIDYDPSILEFSAINEVAPNAIRIDDEFLSENFGLPGVGGVPLGKITFVWDAPGAREITLEDGETLFEVCFIVKSTEETTISFSDTPTDIQIVDKDEQSIDFNGDPGLVNGPVGNCPQANFTASSRNINVGESVSFTDLTSRNPTMWSWSFPGGSPSSSTAQNPTVVYNTPGTYSVTLIATNAECSDTEVKSAYIIVGDGSFDVFTFDITDAMGDVGEEVCVSVDVHKAPDILGMQFTINYDPALVTFTRVTTLNSKLRIDADFLEDNFGLPNGNPPIAAGNITFLWDAPGATAVSFDEDGETLFEICFRVVQDEKVILDFGNEPTTIQIIDENEEVIPFNSDPGEINGAEAPTILSPATITDVNCFGENTGAIDISVQGGTGSYRYQWSFGNSTSQDLTGVPAGTYSVTVTDSNTGLFSTSSYTIGQPTSGINISNIAVTDISCFGDDNGAIDVTASGGTGNLSYSWNQGLPASQDQQNLSPSNSYRVSITDALNCTLVSEDIVVIEPQELSISNIDVVDVSCFGEGDGRINLTISGGTPTFNYVWSNGLTENSNLQENVAPGNYRVTITDNNNCRLVSDDITMAQPSQILISSITANTIDNGNDGAVSVSANGGTGTLSYSWAGPNSFSSDSRSVTGLSDFGEYCVTISDENNCSIEECVTLSERLQIGSTNITPSCAGDATGIIEISASGGTPDYTYQWSNGTNGPTLSNVPAGNYSVTVTDGDGEEIVASYEVPGHPQIELIAQVTDVTGNANSTNGSINLTINGGQSPYEISWNNGASTQNISNLAAGEYCVTVTDQRGCESNICAQVVFLSGPLSANMQVMDAKCDNASDGSITINIVGGVAPYRVEFNDGEQFENISGNVVTRDSLAAGTYTYSVIDVRGTTETYTATIDEPSPISLTGVEILHDTEEQGCNGSINLTLEGGTPDYSVSWNAAGTGLQIVNLCEIEGGFIPTVTDANGCTTTFEPIQINTFGFNGAITDATCPEDADGIISLEVSGGEMPYSYEWMDEMGNIVANSEQASNLIAGAYTIRVSEASGNTLSKTFNIGVQSNLGLDLVVLSDFNGFGVSCEEATNGSLRAIGLNSDGNYSYEWTNNDVFVGAEPNLTGVGIGMYKATVFDGAGCMISKEVELTAPPAVSLEGTVGEISCPGDRNGEIFVEVVGGVSNVSFLYSWNNGEAGPRITNLSPGTYSVTATDINGCNANATFELVEPDSILVRLETQPATERTNDGCNGAIRAVVTGGTSPYLYDWKQKPSETGPTINNECPGTFIVQITDDNGCRSSEYTGIIENKLFPCLDNREVISPDGDGLNDSFVLFCSGDLVDNHLEIYNKWGQLVYVVDNYDCSDLGGFNCWEGESNNGEELPQGAYYYVLEYKDVEGNLVQKKGSISLIRE